MVYFLLPENTCLFTVQYSPGFPLASLASLLHVFPISSWPGVPEAYFLCFLTPSINPSTSCIFPGKHHFLPGLCILMISKLNLSLWELYAFSFPFLVSDIFTYLSQREIKFATPKMEHIISFLKFLLHSSSQWMISLSMLMPKSETWPFSPYSPIQPITKSILFSVSSPSHLSCPHSSFLFTASASFCPDCCFSYCFF